MDVYSTSFTHPRARHLHPPPSSIDLSTDPSSDSPDIPQDVEVVGKVAMMAQSLHGCQVRFSMAKDPGCWNWHIMGQYQQVMAARGMILKEGPMQNSASIKVVRTDILYSPSGEDELKPEIRTRLDDVASQTLAHIAVVNSQSALSNRTPPDGINSIEGWSGLEAEPVCELVLTGPSDAVDHARILLLVMLDELSGLCSESCDIEYTHHFIVAGRQRSVLQSIQEETATNIYLPSPLQGLLGPMTDLSSPRNSVIWITGEFFGVQRARDMLFQVSLTKAKTLQSRDTAILPRKLHWLVTDRQDDLRAIMSDNATFIRIPSLGSTTSLITVYGDHRVNIQRTIRSIMHLACQFYVASFWLLPMHFNALLTPSSLNPAQVGPYIENIANSTDAEVVFKTMCFEVHGLEPDVRAAVAMLMDLDLVKPYHHEIRFQIELANEHREFISGKKNGKINKIMQTTNVKIKFETFNDHNFLIDVAGPDGSVLQGLSLLQEELPAEISFHVPEAYHKRIIGVGGRSIQRIMKKYGVYVKFSNAEEFSALGGYSNNEDNVVARTPAKNAISLDNLKQSVMELVNPKDKDYVNETVAIPRRYHRTLLGEKSIFIHDIESKTNSHVRFPDKESASDIVTVFGPESQVQIATAMLLDHVPFEADMAIPSSPDVSRVCSTPEFSSLVERIKRELQVSVTPNFGQPTPGTDFPVKYSFKFRCQRSNSDFLSTAREMVDQFLKNHNITVSTHTHKRGDSFTESFPHFDSKVLPTVARTRNHESADLGRPSETTDRTLRLASSSPDVKAMFNYSNNYNYGQEEPDTTAQIYGDADSEYWSVNSIGNDTAYEERDDAIKRGSDSLLESKLREQYGNKQPRSLQNRAQSLDLTFSLSKITEASRLPPDSPTTSTGDGESSSPGSATAPSFPSVYHPTTSTKKAVIGPPGARASINATIPEGLGDENVEEVARVISNLGL